MLQILEVRWDGTQQRFANCTLQGSWWSRSCFRVEESREVRRLISPVEEYVCYTFVISINTFIATFSFTKPHNITQGAPVLQQLIRGTSQKLGSRRGKNWEDTKRGCRGAALRNAGIAAIMWNRWKSEIFQERTELLVNTSATPDRGRYFQNKAGLKKKWCKKKAEHSSSEMWLGEHYTIAPNWNRRCIIACNERCWEEKLTKDRKTYPES